MEKLRAIWRDHYQFIIFFCTATIVLIVINHWFWPTPDEYLYANLAKAFTAAAHGRMHWTDINTEHVGLVAYLSYLYNTLFQPQTFFGSRGIIFGFSLGIILLLYAMTFELGLATKHRMWFLWLLLLIPGFWVFSVRLMLDIPATFGIALIIYLLIKKSPSYQIGLATALLLGLKEYYVYLTLPLFMIVFGLDAWKSHGSVWHKLLSFCKTMFICYFPTFVLTIILLDFPIFPYPRLLENNLQFIFGDLFNFTNKIALIGLNAVITLAQEILKPLGALLPQPAHVVQHVANKFATLNPISNITSTQQQVITQLHVNVATIPHTTVMNSLQNRINNIQLTGQLPTGLIDSPATVVSNKGFLSKLWLIYSYNFSETDLNIFILPLTFLGIGLSLQNIFHQFKHQYSKIRPTIIFGSLFLVFIYFNYHEADSIHGFRVTLPLILSLIFFSYIAVQYLLTHFLKKPSIYFSILSLGSIILYWFTIKDLTYGSVLANASILGKLLIYKPYVFIAFFLGCLGGIVYFPKLQWRWKYVGLGILIFCLFWLKLIPFYFDNRQSLQYYEYNYGLAKTTPILEQVRTSYTPIYANIHPYMLQYYTNDYRMANEGIVPSIRYFPQGYYNLYFHFPTDNQLFDNLVKQRVEYVLIVNDTFDNSSIIPLEQMVKSHPTRFSKVTASYHNNRLQWELYRISY